jgi:hypothetical protein
MTQVGQNYPQASTLGGGTTPPHRYAISAASLPAGTTPDTSTGLISGTSTTPGNFSFGQVGSQVGYLQQRLADVADVTANLIAELCELNELRDRFRAAQLSARRSRRIDGKKRPRF